MRADEGAGGAAMSRRWLLRMLAAAPVGALGLATAADAATCYDPAKLPAAQVSMRRSLGFKEQAPTPAKQCGGCTFFTAAAGGCGKCALLSGGVVSAGSVCDSWAKRG